jgi:hypothetical protein
MAPHKTVTINGRLYDAVTGLPIESISVTDPNKKPIKKKPAPAPAKKPEPKTSRGVTNSEIVHSNVQRSKTLHRRATKKPEAPNKPITKRAAPGRHMDIARSASVTRFAKDPVTTAPVPKPKAVVPAAKPDKPARVHPVAERAATRRTIKKAAAPAKPVTAKQVKDAEISKALATPKAKEAKPSKSEKKTFKRVLIIGSAVLIVLIGLYAAWRLIPNISVSIAAAQAGIEATYPEYTPDGYSLSQPVTYSDGEVDLKFTSNSNENYYTVSQTRSSWDSSAVLDNVVTPAAGADYTTTKERGLTIYTYGTNAAWVNGGILYEIDSKAPLSGDQIRKIATSL